MFQDISLHYKILSFDFLSTYRLVTVNMIVFDHSCTVAVTLKTSLQSVLFDRGRFPAVGAEFLFDWFL